MALTDPDQDVLIAAFQRFKDSEYPTLSEGEAFEIFASTELLKQYSPSSGEIIKGIAGSKHDGGIDSFYVVLNENEILDIDSPLVTGQAAAVQGLPDRPTLDVFVIQSKWSDSWRSEPLTKIRDTLTQLLPRTADEKSLEAVYNTDIMDRTRIYRAAYTQALAKSPIVRIHVFYVTKGSASHLEQAADQLNKTKLLREAVLPMIPTDGRVEVTLLGASGMCERMRTNPATIVPIEFSHDLIRAQSSFVGLVKIRDYLRFIHRDSSNELRPGLFESNVRDFAGEAGTVNSAIRSTITSEEDTSFWWLNNGVTILADHAQDVPPHGVTLTRPLIVNGLQTTNVIHLASLKNEIPDARMDQSLLVRIITAADSATRDAVIAGTNRQTNITSVQLKATELIHTQIEEFLATRNWFYERRKNQYRNAGKPASRILSINELAQAMIAVSLGRPADARARPSSLINRPEVYDQIFPDGAERAAYAVAVEVMEVVDAFIKSPTAKAILDDPSNVRYYVATGYVMKKLRIRKHGSIRFFQNYPRVKPSSDDPVLTTVLVALNLSADTILAKDKLLTRDQVFKGSELADRFFAALYPSKR
jgi:hypothetical protein